MVDKYNMYGISNPYDSAQKRKYNIQRGRSVMSTLTSFAGGTGFDPHSRQGKVPFVSSVQEFNWRYHVQGALNRKSKRSLVGSFCKINK